MELLSKILISTCPEQMCMYIQYYAFLNTSSVQ